MALKPGSTKTFKTEFSLVTVQVVKQFPPHPLAMSAGVSGPGFSMDNFWVKTNHQRYLKILPFLEAIISLLDLKKETY